jgi:putative pyruvate formate lyase activating enzyme
VYLPDLKTLNTGLAERFFKAPDYPVYAASAIRRMIETRRIRFRGSVLVSGVIVRHLVLPGHLDSTKEVLHWFAEHWQGRALFSLMTQYTPVGKAEPARRLSENEYKQVLQWLEDFGIDGYYQEFHIEDAWLPDFRRQNPFSSDLSTPVWHWSCGTIPPPLTGKSD